MISDFSNSIKSENFFYNYLLYYYGDLENALNTLIKYLSKSAPVLHMIYVVGDLVDFGKLDIKVISNLEKIVNAADIETSAKYNILNMYYKKLSSSKRSPDVAVRNPGSR